MDNHGWYDIQMALDPTGVRYLIDVDQGWLSVHTSNLNAFKHSLLDAPIGDEVRYALTSASMHSFSYNIPVKLLIALITNNLWDTKAGVRYSCSKS